LPEFAQKERAAQNSSKNGPIGNRPENALASFRELPDQHAKPLPGMHLGHDFSTIRVVDASRKTMLPASVAGNGPVQAKLTINQPGDRYEQEADRIAAQVMTTPAHTAVSGTPPRIQRFVGQSSGQMDAAPTSVDSVLASPGRLLEPELQQDMGQRFGHDFSQVRVHSGAAADQSARDVKANAYTVGQNIVFGAGRFAPGTQEGRRLIAHELTHVVQQQFARTPFANSLSVSDPADFFEAEAAQAKYTVISQQSVPLPGNHAAGLSPAPPTTHLATRPIIQRQRRADLPVPSPASPASSTPSATANPEPEGPGLDFARFTTIEINNPKFSLEIKIPKSIDIKFKAFEAKLAIPKGVSVVLRPVRGIPGLQIGLSGEITKLADLIESPASTPTGPSGFMQSRPLRFSLSIGVNGKYYSVDATTSVDLSERAITTGISLTLLGSNVKHQVPSSVINDLNVAGEQLRNVVNKLMGTADQPASPTADELQPSPSPATPSPELTSDLSDLADAIGKIIEAMDKIDKSKGEEARSTLTFGPTATIPYGQPGEDGKNSNLVPSVGFNFGGTF